MPNQNTESSEYNSRGQNYHIVPLGHFEPITGDNIGLSFHVTTNEISASPTIRISGTVQAIWGIRREDQEVRHALVELGKLKISEEIEKGTDLRYLDYMFISNDPVMTNMLDGTLTNLRQELDLIIETNQSRTYQQKKKELHGLLTDIFSTYDQMNNTVKNGTGYDLYQPTTISGTMTQMLSQEFRTKEEYHWGLMLESLPFEAMDFSRLDSSFPTRTEVRQFNDGLQNVAGEKAEYVFVGTINSLTQLDILIRNFDRPSRTNHVRTLKAVHGLRNTFPTHSNTSYRDSRRELGLPDNSPENAGGDDCAYIDELLIINQRLKDAIKVVAEKVTAIIAQSAP